METVISSLELSRNVSIVLIVWHPLVFGGPVLLLIASNHFLAPRHTVSLAVTAQDAPSAPVATGKLVKVDGVPAGELFGGGGAISAELSADGRWIIVVDDR